MESRKPGRDTHTQPPAVTRGKRRLHQSGGDHDYGGNPDLTTEADAPGDRVQGSDGGPVTGQP